MFVDGAVGIPLGHGGSLRGESVLSVSMFAIEAIPSLSLFPQSNIVNVIIELQLRNEPSNDEIRDENNSIPKYYYCKLLKANLDTENTCADNATHWQRGQRQVHY